MLSWLFEFLYFLINFLTVVSSTVLILLFIFYLKSPKYWCPLKNREKSIRGFCPHRVCGARQSLASPWYHEICLGGRLKVPFWVYSVDIKSTLQVTYGVYSGDVKFLCRSHQFIEIEEVFLMIRTLNVEIF